MVMGKIYDVVEKIPRLAGVQFNPVFSVTILDQKRYESSLNTTPFFSHICLKISRTAL